MGRQGQSVTEASQLLVPQDAARPEDGDAGRVWSGDVPGGGHLSHGDAEDPAAGCWASG